MISPVNIANEIEMTAPRHLLAGRGTPMTDVLVRGVPDDVAGALDAQAQRLGLSRTEYLRRQLVRIAASEHGPVTTDMLRDFTAAFADLADPDVMRGAWE